MGAFTDWCDHNQAELHLCPPFYADLRRAGQLYGWQYSIGDPAAQFFSYDGLCKLTQQYVTQGGVAGGMCAKLSAAEAVEARGDNQAKRGALGAYVNQVAAQSGKSLTRSRATTLTALAGAL